MISVNIIGSGNVASHLLKAFSGKVNAIAVNPHTLANLDPQAEFTIISVADRAIREVVSALPTMKGIVAHTSGSVGIDVLNSINNNYGVFYPLQTFSKNVKLKYENIPFFIEGDSRQTVEGLKNLASLISQSVTEADSEKRKSLHVASVFACNFANHLWACADSILNKHGLSFDSLRPLLEETLRKTEEIPPKEAQTGPARRNDDVVIDSHLAFLSDSPNLNEIYSLLTKSILTTYNDNPQDIPSHG